MAMVVYDDPKCMLQKNNHVWLFSIFVHNLFPNKHNQPTLTLPMVIICDQLKTNE
jgi:hypothetical protein